MKTFVENFLFRLFRPGVYNTAWDSTITAVVWAVAVKDLYNCSIYFLFQVVGGRCYHFAFWPSFLVNHAVGVFIIFIQFIIPLFILMYCYGRIVWVLSRRIVSNIGSFSDNNPSGNRIEDYIKHKFQLARMNTIKTFLMVGISFIICWSSNQIYFLMHNLGYKINWNSVFHQFTVSMVFVNCTVNPFIYLIKYRDYQEALKKLFHCQKRNSLEGSETKLSNVSFTRDFSGISI